MTNASFVYYRSPNFGRDLNEKEFKLAAIQGINYADYFKIDKTLIFNLKTTYPGLIIGAGYTHPALKEGDFQLGFYFDHTTGMPVIPGSTVKGILKSVFPKKGEADEIKREKLKYFNGLIKQITGKDTLLNDNNCGKLFEKGNIFFDAFISAIPDNGRVFAEDYITPHKNIFKNPIPIRFLKIAPDVTFTFQFKLKDGCFKNSQKISSNEKLKLFKQILLDFGIGAKRNVGYGNLIEA